MPKPLYAHIYIYIYICIETYVYSDISVTQDVCDPLAYFFITAFHRPFASAAPPRLRRRHAQTDIYICIELTLARSLLREGGGPSCDYVWSCSRRVFVCVTSFSSNRPFASAAPPRLRRRHATCLHTRTLNVCKINICMYIYVYIYIYIYIFVYIYIYTYKYIHIYCIHFDRQCFTGHSRALRHRGCDVAMPKPLYICVFMYIHIYVYTYL